MELEEQIAAHAAVEGAEEIITTLSSWLLDPEQHRSAQAAQITRDALLAAHAVRTLLQLARRARERKN